MENKQMSSGLPGLDRALGGVLAGDNIVWLVDSIDDYLRFVRPYCEYAAATQKKLVYFRFARHEPLVTQDMGAEIHELQPEHGFEAFLTQIHDVIENAGRGAYYVFDCLSDLLADWYSDQMLANFFVLTCPYLFDLDTVAFFALLRDHHSSQATSPIIETTQLFLDVYRHKDRLYVYPIKVQHRYSPTMYMLHGWQGDEFVPVADSATISEILSSRPPLELETGSRRLDAWSRTFAEAEHLRDNPHARECSVEEGTRYFDRLLRMAISREQRMLDLTGRYFTMSDLIGVGRRMIGTGLIGGKAVGLLLARAILRKEDPRWADLLEVHDSFYVASDVFYTFLVRNGCWWVREGLHDPENFLRAAKEGRRLILRGVFPDYLVKEFSDMLDYFGQSPIIVRSSSLLEDNFGNAFAGKYESVFCANQGSRAKRLEDFMSAVRTVYASAMSENALRYRAERGLLDRDEQMSLLVQRVSGSLHGHLFYPHLAGVGLSYNPYVWNEYIDPEAGMIRLVFGLGTRAVDRTDDDYTRLVALNAPDRQPEASADQARRHAQRKVDVLELGANQLVAMDFRDVVRQSPALPIEKIASRDPAAEALARERKRDLFTWNLTFDQLLNETDFVRDMREMLAILNRAYHYPVDVEFTANFLPDQTYRINLLQCRPLQVSGSTGTAEPPADIPADRLIFESRGPVIGPSRIDRIDRLIFVSPAGYSRLPLQEQYAIARLVGRVVHAEGPNDSRTIMLLGPGRWGTSTASLGVPVSFAEINQAAVLCELVTMREDLVPDVSLGTHFFSDLVERDILYLAIFPGREGHRFLENSFHQRPNRLAELVPDAPDAYAEIVKVIDVERHLLVNANAVKQRAVCYLEKP